MTAALTTPLETTSGGGGPDPREWVTLAFASERIGQHPNHLSRVAGQSWQPLGLAKKHEGRWYVKRCVHDKLALEYATEETPSLDRFSERQLHVAFQRIAAVKAYRAWRDARTGPEGAWIGTLIAKLRHTHDGLKVSQRSLQRWHLLYETPADVVKLIDNRGGDNGGQGDPAAWKFFRSRYLTEHRRSVKACWRQTSAYARQKGLRWLTLPQCRRRLDEKVPVQDRVKYRDPRTYRSTLAPYIEQPVDRFYAGECYEGDHAQLDLWVRYGQRIVRPWLTAWRDWRSGRVVGWNLTETPDSTSILAALRHALTDKANHGGPEKVWIDNGKDYDSWVFHGQTKKERRMRITQKVRLDESQALAIFDMLKIEAHFAQAHNPNGKSKIERWFGVLHDQFDKEFATYCGSSPASKPEGLNAILKQPHRIPTFEHVRDELRRFIDEYNAEPAAPIHMEGLSPDAYMAQHCRHRRVMADPKALDLILQKWQQPVTVGRNGITIAPFGTAIRYGQFSHELRRYKGTGQKVRVSYDPHDVRTVRVFDEKLRLICEATINVNSGGGAYPISEATLKETLREQKRYNRAHKIVSSEPASVVIGGMARRMAVAAREQAAERAEPPATKLIQTPVDGQSKHARPAIKARPLPAGHNVLDLLSKANERNSAVRPRPRTLIAPPAVAFPDRPRPRTSDDADDLTLLTNLDLATDGASRKVARHA